MREITSGQKVINENLFEVNEISREQNHITIKLITYKLWANHFFAVHSPTNKQDCSVQCLRDFIKLRGVQNGPLFAMFQTFQFPGVNFRQY